MRSSLVTSDQAIDKLIVKTETANLPAGLEEKVDEIYSQLKLNSKAPEIFWESYERVAKYIDWVVKLPWEKSSKDILDINYAKEKLNEGHHGLTDIKERLLEYISVLALQKARNPEKDIRAPILLFVGLVGTGKTTMAQSIAHVLNREFVRIPFGGLGDPAYLRGISRINPESEPGQIIKALISAKTKNPVILLDEIDRVADEALNTVMGVLVELLDPEQNHKFTDNYIDYPFDLSQVLFCATCNNTTRIATAVMDRLEPIQMPSYNDEEKIAIGRDYILGKAITEAGLTSQELKISDSVWPQIVRPLGFDAGVRTLKRNIEGLCRKVAKMIFEGQVTQVAIDETNIKQYLPQW
ncbi:MAG: AAA family ATPase [Candidatus Shapirobacteria bacterium]|nr:AAA family ATPase [Candidatus Shapirobacteria bacterium]